MLPQFQTRYVMAFGFFVLGCRRCSPAADAGCSISGRWRCSERSRRSGWRSCSCPTARWPTRTLPRSLNADATALYSMFRNIAGSIGIAVVTALGAERLQVHRAYWRAI